MKTGHWLIKVPAGEFMSGTHRFETKRAALAFRNEWLYANPDALQVPKLSNDSPRRVRDQAQRDLGMVKVRGALGGTYWE